MDDELTRELAQHADQNTKLTARDARRHHGSARLGQRIIAFRQQQPSRQRDVTDPLSSTDRFVRNFNSGQRDRTIVMLLGLAAACVIDD